MILATAWNQEPLHLHDAAIVSALNECLCCLGDLRLRLWRSEQTGCRPSAELLTRAIHAVEGEAREFTSEVLVRQAPATLVTISDTMTITTTSSPDLLTAWMRLRLGDLVDRLPAISGGGTVTQFLIEDAAERIAVVCGLCNADGGDP